MKKTAALNAAPKDHAKTASVNTNGSFSAVILKPGEPGPGNRNTRMALSALFGNGLVAGVILTFAGVVSAHVQVLAAPKRGTWGKPLNPGTGQACLSQTHRTAGRVECRCNVPAPEMSVAAAAGRVIVRRKPRPDHVVDCVSFPPTEERSGLTQALAISPAQNAHRKTDVGGLSSLIGPSPETQTSAEPEL